MLQWPDSTLYEALQEISSEHPTKTALFTEDGSLSYQELLEESRALTSGLEQLGVEAGDTIAVWLSNRPEWIKAQLAASHLGAALVAVNTRYRTHELKYMLRDSKCETIITEKSFLNRDYLSILEELVPEINSTDPSQFSSDTFPNLSEVIAVESADEYSAVRNLHDVVERGRRTSISDASTDPEAPVTVFYTSGTTSNPKGCLQTNRSVLNHSYRIGDYFEVGGADMALDPMPFCGIMGFNMMLSSLTHGCPLVVIPYFDADRVLGEIEKRSVTYISGTDAMFERMISANSFETSRVSSVERGAVFFANGFDEGTFDRIEQKMGFPVVQPYGLSEANSQIFVGDPSDCQENRKKVGGPLIFPQKEEARIVNPETGESLPPGEKGELCLRGFNVIESYLNKPEATDHAFDSEGWFHTGDLCEKDENNYFYYHSRLDDALRVRGFLVSPPEIETALTTHPKVTQSQIVGASHPRHGQVPVAFIQVMEPVDEDSILNHLDGRIADYKIPESIITVEEYPTTEGPNGKKVQKSELRKRVEDLFTES